MKISKKSICPAALVLAQGPQASCPDEHISTAIGCVPYGNINQFAGFFLRWGLGLAGGIAILLIIYASFLLITSSGDPKKTQAGKELLTASIGGLIFLIFSAFILRFVGINIFNIQGFGA